MIIPSQKTGVAYPNNEKNVTIWLKILRGRRAAITPINVPRKTARTNAERVNINVAGKWLIKRDKTDSS